jgi:hypothetical protein
MTCYEYLQANLDHHHVDRELILIRKEKPRILNSHALSLKMNAMKWFVTNSESYNLVLFFLSRIFSRSSLLNDYACGNRSSLFMSHQQT